MRPFLLCAAALLCAACSSFEEPLPPSGRFYFPTGIAFVRSPPGSATDDGMLYVATSNFDKRYGAGKVTAIDLAALRTASPGLPALAGSAGGGAVNLEDLSGAISDEVTIQSFAGEMTSYLLPDGGTRLFVPTRAEGSLLHSIDTVGGTLECVAGQGAKDCRQGSVSLSNWDPSERVAKPRAQEPIGVGISAQGDVFVSHIQPADNPIGSGQEFESYLVRLHADNPQVINAASFTSIGSGGSNSVAVGKRYAYVTGRFNSPPLRLVDTRRATDNVLISNLEGTPFMSESYNALDQRGVVLSSDERRVYMATRLPDSLVVMDIDGPEREFPSLKVANAVAAPEGPNLIQLIERPGRGALVLMTCTAAGVLAIFDEDLGSIVAQVPAVGFQPYGLAVDRRGNAARVFVSNFGDGTVAVVDINDLLRPYEAHLVGRLGAPQTCIVRERDASCKEVAP